MTEKVTENDWRFKDKIRTIVSKNVKEVPYEGKEVDEAGIVDEIVALLTSKEYSVLNHTKSY